jgi:hypothetical protein
VDCVPRLGLGWKALFVMFALTGFISYVPLFTRSEGLFDVLGRAFRRYVWRRLMMLLR